MKLPHDWWFFGLDSQGGKLSTSDRRHPEHCHQLRFFKTLLEQHPIRRLIVATPEPSTVYGQLRQDRYAPEKDHLTATFTEIGIPRGFHSNGKIDADRCQLDLSGDVHHYARYWGPKSVARDNYASVVSGLGGAFVHPTQLRRGKLEPRPLYPSPEESRKHTAKIALPWVIAGGGWLWALGALIAAIVYSALFKAGERWNGSAWLFGGAAPKDLRSIESLMPVLGTLRPSIEFIGACAALGGLLHLARRNKKRLRVKAETENTTFWDRLGARVLYIAPIALFLISLPRIVPHATTDFIRATTLLVCSAVFALGVPVAAASHGAEGLSIGRRALFLGLGLLFGVSQLVVPVLAGLAGFKGTLAVAAVSLAFAVVGHSSAGLTGVAGKALLGTGFLVFTALSIAAPLSVGLSGPPGAGLAFAVLTGAFYVCSSFGAYLLVSLAFDGHFNEVGGAARIEQFKQMIRFCIRRDPDVGSVLEAYVIAIDEPAATRSGIHAKLIDYFEIAPHETPHLQRSSRRANTST